MKTEVTKTAWLMIKIYRKKNTYTKKMHWTIAKNQCTKDMHRKSAHKNCTEKKCTRKVDKKRFTEKSSEKMLRKMHRKMHRKNVQKNYTEKVHRAASSSQALVVYFTFYCIGHNRFLWWTLLYNGFHLVWLLWGC